MKIVRYQKNDIISYGLLKDKFIFPIVGDIFNDYNILDIPVNLKEVNLLSPIVPGKIIAVGLNYYSHVGEFDFANNIPDEPMIFLVSNTAVIGTEEEIKLPFINHRIDHECELVVVMGKECKNVDEEKALEYVLGYTCGNDVSDRDIQKKDGQWTRGKSYPTFKPIGPWIETELDPDNLLIQTFVNNEIKQESNTNKMIFKPSKLISFISKIMPLFPGDLIFTGTPEGVAPIKKGDVVEVRIEGIGVLKNYVK